MKKVILTAAILLVFGCALFLTGHSRTAAFGPPGHHGSFMHFRHMLGFWNELDLSDEQLDALEELKEETQTEIEPLIEDILELGVEEALLSDEIDTDPSNAQQKLAMLVDLQSQITGIVTDAMLAGALILTPEQRQVLLEEIENIKQDMDNGHGHWGPWGARGVRR